MKKITLLLTFIFTSVLYSQTAFDFLRLDISPRAAALAGAFVSNTDDPNVIFYNPAGLNLIKGQQASFSYLKHLLDINSASLSYSRDVKGIGRISGAVAYINYGRFTKADEFGNKNGEFGAADLAFVAGYSNVLGKNFYYGASVKFIYSGIADRNSTAAAMDVGLLYYLPDSRWSFGFSALNAGFQLSSYAGIKEKLPLDVRLGASKTLAHLPFTFYFSLNKLNESTVNFKERLKFFSLGGELRISKVLRFRFGFDNEKRQELKIGTTAGLAGFNFGIGIKIKRYRFDYAFSSLGEIGSLHRMGVTTSF